MWQRQLQNVGFASRSWHYDFGLQPTWQPIAHVHRATVNNFDFKNPRGPLPRCNVLLGGSAPRSLIAVAAPKFPFNQLFWEDVKLCPRVQRFDVPWIFSIHGDYVQTVVANLSLQNLASNHRGIRKLGRCIDVIRRDNCRFLRELVSLSMGINEFNVDNGRPIAVIDTADNMHSNTDHEFRQSNTPQRIS